MRLRALTLPLLALALGVSSQDSLRGQTPGATRIIDVSVTDAAGAPMTTLQAHDLMLRIDGRVHLILDLRLVNQNVERGALPAPYATNQAAAGRTITIAADVTRLESADTPQVRDAVTALIDTLTARDRIGVVALATDGLAADYTTRRDIVRAATARLAGIAPPLQDTKTLEDAAITSLTMLERLCTTLAADPGHKTLVFIAPTFATSSDVRRSIQSLVAVMARQRIQLVVIDPRGGESPMGGLAALAAATGGTLLPFSANLAAHFSAVAGRTAARYQLRFMFTVEEQDDKLHRVQVLSLRKDAQVTALPQILIPKTGNVVEPLAALADMLRQPRTWNDLPLRLAVFPVIDGGRDKLRLLVLGEPESPATPLAWAEFALIAPSGVVIATWKAENADLATRPMMTAAAAPVGAFRVRMAASELSGRRGTVDYEFDARLTPASPLALGPLMFGGIANQAFLPILQFPADANAVMGYAEIYGRLAATDTLASTFEILATADGPPLASILGSVRTTPNDDRRATLANVDLTPLTPGDYLVRAIVTLNGKEIGRVSRTLRKASR